MANIVLLLNKTDRQLKGMATQQNFDGKMARKEIKRRRMVNYCDGTAIEQIDAKAPIVEPESTVGTIRSV